MSLPISIVVCTRNRVDSLRRCVDALFSVRTSQKWELVIVDNGSDDATADFLRSLVSPSEYPVLKTAFQPKRGLTAARNTGWRSARGKIIAFTDDDCYVASDYIDAVVSAFTDNQGRGFVGGRILLYDPTDLPIAIQVCEHPLHLHPRTYVGVGVIQGANMAFRRETLERIGGFDENLGPGTEFNCEDVDAVASALWAGISGAYDPRPTVYHHHGRKSEEERRTILSSYAQGRGAYHAKFALRQDSRSLYIKAWKEKIYWDLRGWVGRARRGNIPEMSDLAHEIYGGAKYVMWHYREQTSAISHRKGTQTF
jgi:glycosyltransferase involved in cell wall biosynthesis